MSGNRTDSKNRENIEQFRKLAHPRVKVSYRGAISADPREVILSKSGVEAVRQLRALKLPVSKKE